MVGNAAEKTKKECLKKEKPGQFESEDCKPVARLLGAQREQVNSVGDRIPGLLLVGCEGKMMPHASRGEVSALKGFWDPCVMWRPESLVRSLLVWNSQECQFSGDSAFNIVLYSGLIKTGRTFDSTKAWSAK